jgi:hypothetical protein
MAHPGIIRQRAAVHERFTALLDAHESRSLTPALDLAVSIRNLSSVQLSVLDALLRVFAESPRTLSQDRILLDLRKVFDA